ALESPSAGLQPAARPSQLPTRSVLFRHPNKKARCLRHTGPETPREGCQGPGVTFAKDRARPYSPDVRRIASPLGNPGTDMDSRRSWTTSVQMMSQANSIRLDSTQLNSGPTSWIARRLVPYRRGTLGGCSRVIQDYSSRPGRGW